jgi:hypothetical protein
VSGATTSSIAPGAETRTASAAAPRSRRRSLWGWAAVAGLLVVVGGAGAALSGLGEWTERDALDPESRGPDGAAAVVELLREGGVDVVIARDRESAREALTTASPATLVTADSPLLADDTLREVVDAATDVVLIDPRARAVDIVLPGALSEGFAPDAPVAPGCATEVATRAGEIVPGRLLQPGTDTGLTACYPAGDGYGLLIGESAAGGVASAMDGREIVINSALAQNGNAALALGLMGRLPTVVWYSPGIDDADIAAEPTLGELTPGWVTPAIVVLAAAAIAAGIWRGRRFGPLVVEDLPVTVRASETMEGRARLYARGRDTGHAADALRVGAAGRLARMLGLGRSADVHTIADAAADRTGAPRARVRALLVDDVPGTEKDLVAISDGLDDLERAVRAALRDEGATR